MDPDQRGHAFIVASDAPEPRYSDAAGPTAPEDPRLREQLEIIRGRRLSQFSMALNGVRLAFWGDEAGSVPREILIENAAVELAQPGRNATTHRWNDDVVATSLLSALGQKLTRIDLTDGHLGLGFDNGLRLRVGPDQQYEAWQISSDDGLLIVCAPGGDLTIWYPDAEG